MKNEIKNVKKGERIFIIANPPTDRDNGYSANSIAPENGLLITSSYRNMDSVYIPDSKLLELGYCPFRIFQIGPTNIPCPKRSRKK